MHYRHEHTPVSILNIGIYRLQRLGDIKEDTFLGLRFNPKTRNLPIATGVVKFYNTLNQFLFQS